jgi:electron transfer flavoprotein alpha subunit
VGIKDTDIMVAVNQDPKAPILKHCDIGLVGDFKEIIPLLVKAIHSYSG